MKKKPEFIKKTVCMRLTQNSIDYLNALAYNKGSSIGIEVESIIQNIIKANIGFSHKDDNGLICPVIDQQPNITSEQCTVVLFNEE